MITLFTGTIVLSLLHGLIPSHWIPVLALKEKFGWTNSLTLRIAIWAALAHSLSTVLLGVSIGLFSSSLVDRLSSYTHWVIPVLLILTGGFFIAQHHRHHHFHLAQEKKLNQVGALQVTTLLIFMMFLSPCLEIEAYFLMAGAYGWKIIMVVGLLYTLISVFSIVFWIGLAQKGLHKLNWHSLEHKAGLISGVVLVVTGIISFFTH